ncbi:MAG TPA: sigma-70 family RNA polymerase sigma factor, partial [Gemmataceae bacterium]|nr:sigma-70 family RNA polymerase sigma factor [Gemmataceae bacterium]
MGTDFRLAAVARQLQAGDDFVLLGRYARDRDEAAFAALIRRHGALVLGVARRQLAPTDLADDVFQATFLALARAAGRLRERTSLVNWLYTVALRQARKARGRAARRAAVERAARPPAAATDDPLAVISGRDLVRAVDEEVARLPEKYRLPVLLCCVQGLSREEAAAQLGWTDGAVKGRLERGRRRLAGRLAARGLAPAGLLFTTVVPPDLIARTARLAAAPWARTVPADIAALAATAAPRRLVPVAILVGSIVATGVAGWAVAGGQTKPKDEAAPPARAEAAASDPLPAGSVLRFGTDRFRHGTRIGTLAVSPDGTFAVAGSDGHIHGTARAYDLADGRVRYTLGGPRHTGAAVAISPDGTTIALAGEVGNAIDLHDARTGKPVRQIKLPNTGGGTITNWV